MLILKKVEENFGNNLCIIFNPKSVHSGCPASQKVDLLSLFIKKSRATKLILLAFKL